MAHIKMMTKKNLRPYCYFAVFGNPYALGHVHVEDGDYGHKNLASELKPGDMILLYCTGSYEKYSRSVPGIGIVSEVNQEIKKFRYDYFPLSRALPLEYIRFQITGDDFDKLSNIRFDSYWFFRISNESFSSVMQGALLSSNGEEYPQQGPLLE